MVAICERHRLSLPGVQGDGLSARQHGEGPRTSRCWQRLTRGTDKRRRGRASALSMAQFMLASRSDIAGVWRWAATGRTGRPLWRFAISFVRHCCSVSKLTRVGASCHRAPPAQSPSPGASFLTASTSSRRTLTPSSCECVRRGRVATEAVIVRKAEGGELR